MNLYGGSSRWAAALALGLAERYLAFEYLPRTDDNLALTDIRAQHPMRPGRRDGTTRKEQP
jgi:hypothetical protein